MLPCRSYKKRFTQKQFRRYCQTTSCHELIAVWIFHRHGDRTPGKSLVEDSYKDQESAFWRTKIPPTDHTHYEMMSERYRAVVHPENNGGNFLDSSSGSEPYGFLTWKGMQQLYEQGKTIGQRYKPEHEIPFIEYWNVQAFSTNYLRTVKSLQCLLDGIFNTGRSFSRHAEGTIYEHVDPESYLQSEHIPMINILVRDPKHETLNKFDTSPETMRNLVRNVVKTPDFLEQDAGAAPLATRLSNYIPGLARFRSPHGSPSAINWIYAADHFTCRAAHNLPFNAFSRLEDRHDVEQTLQALKHATISHLASRFRSWYKSPPLLAEMMLPLLTELHDDIFRCANMSSADGRGRKPFRIYSCHDVTILALLYSIEASFLASSEDLKSHGLYALQHFEHYHYWPEYACTLAIEMSKVQTKGKADEFLLKFLLNGNVVQTITSLQKEQHAISILDFGDILTRMAQNAK